MRMLRSFIGLAMLAAVISAPASAALSSAAPPDAEAVMLLKEAPDGPVSNLAVGVAVPALPAARVSSSAQLALRAQPVGREAAPAWRHAVAPYRHIDPDIGLG